MSALQMSTLQMSALQISAHSTTNMLTIQTLLHSLLPFLARVLALRGAGHRVLGVDDHGHGDGHQGGDRVQVEGDPEQWPAQQGSDHQLQGGGERLQDGVELLEEQAGDDAEDGVVDYNADDERVGDGGEGGVSESAGKVALTTEQKNVTKDGVEVHEDILYHDVDVVALPLDQELVIDPGEHGAEHLHDDE